MSALFLVPAVALLLLIACGWGLTHLLLPRPLRIVSYLFTPFVGLALVDSVGHLTSFAGMSGRDSLGVVLVVALLLNALYLLARRDKVRAPSRFELLLALAALPALVGALAPLVPEGQLLPIGRGNGDAVAHTTTTVFLTDYSLRDPVPYTIEHPVYRTVQDKMDRNIRLGFHFYHAYTSLLAGREAFQSYPVIVAVGFWLWAAAAGIFTRFVLHRSQGESLLATFLLSISALPLWITFGGFGPQVLGMGLLIAALTAWITALQSKAWRDVWPAAVLSAGLAGIYSEALPWLVVPAGLYALGRFWLEDPPRRQIITTVAAGGILTVLFNPVGWGRASFRAVDLSARVAARSPGNVDWLIDFRQVAGLIPFSREVAIWYGGPITSLLWLPAIVLVAAMLYGFWRLNNSTKAAILAFIIPHMAVLFWLGHGPGNYAYGYFKAWSIGWFAYVALLAIGVSEVRRRATGRQAIRVSAVGLTAGVALLFLFNSALLVRDLNARLPISPAMLEAVSWSEELPEDATIYIVPGEINLLSAYWMTHLLREHPIASAGRILYSRYAGEPYRGEPYLLRHASAAPVWNADVWAETVQKSNEQFSLLTLEPRQPRSFGYPMPLQHNVRAILGDTFELLGYNVDVTSDATGATVTADLYWLALEETDRAYKIFVHLIDDRGQVVAQCDTHPRNWTYFTYFWEVGEVVEERCELRLGQGAPAGPYQLQAGLYLEEAGARLPVIQNGEPRPSNSVLLDPALHIN